ncbi:Golgi-associated olfactory signaling regulator [Spea bombifrons]|uniref:Golgi-associated olfactory signaling regulator n=1 Tax=Spea bombifrons TaxID=233779 RepID=UPI0023495E28|nr:Golgi-associated olfactory signaling regulator [Spea bombifrons]
MAGVLGCLLILVYCIYNRQHKEDMFSHHRLYGEGFEDPVLHLDTPVDHFDFFAFRDTEITPTPTPQHKPRSIININYENEFEAEPPKDKPSDEHQKQAIQMDTLNNTT